MGRLSPIGLSSARIVVHKPSTDEELTLEAAVAAQLLRSGGGDRKAFCALYELTQSKLLAICLGICRDRSDAEDAMIEIYLSIWRNAAAWRPERGSALAWLASIARYRAIDVWRRRRRRDCDGLEDTRGLVDPAPNAETFLLNEEARDNLHHCINKLTHQQREVICSAFLEGKTYAEVAQLNGVPHGTAKSWARRGLARLKTSLQSVDASEPVADHPSLSVTNDWRI